MTEREKEIVRRLMHPVYTVDYLEELLERKDNVFVNPVAAGTAMGAEGLYFAIQAMAEQWAGMSD